MAAPQEAVPPGDQGPRQLGVSQLLVSCAFRLS